MSFMAILKVTVSVPAIGDALFKSNLNYPTNPARITYL